jgi:hypothetical protein
MSAFKIRLWAVIGPPNSGKSSVVGAMVSQSGRGRGGARDVLLRGGGWLYIHAYRRSVQEADRSPAFSADKIEKAAASLDQKTPIAYYNVLLALRSDSIGGHPTAAGYLSHYVRSGWDLQSLILLDMSAEYWRYARFGVPTYDLQNSTELTANSLQRNWVFGQARNHFGWA